MLKQKKRPEVKKAEEITDKVNIPDASGILKKIEKKTKQICWCKDPNCPIRSPLIPVKE